MHIAFRQPANWQYPEEKNQAVGKGSATNMTCRELIDFLMAYLSGELSSGERIEFESHLQECPDCVVYLKSYEHTIQLGKRAFADPEAPVSADVPEELIQAILASRRQEA